MPEKRYQRLTRTRARSAFAVAFQSRVSLWLGEDHLLCVDTNGYSESYKRFNFRDIQAVTIRESARRNTWNAILVLPVVICVVGLLISLFPADNIAAIVVWSIFAALFVTPFVMNNLLGATCACQLQTAVQTEELPSLCRVRQTRKVLAKIRPLIAAAQGGGLSAADVSARLQEWAASPAGTEPVKTTPDEPNIPPRLAS